MVRAAIIGASGMLGKTLADKLEGEMSLNGRRLEKLILSDVRQGVSNGKDTVWITGDAADPAVAERLVAEKPDVIFHVAATAMGQADSDFAIGYHINFDTVRTLVETLRLAGEAYCPRVIHASSIGVFGAPFADTISDQAAPRPDSSYGTQKLMSEAIIADYTRMGFISGVCLRLPTIAVRPGVPTHGNSGFFSNIIREPLEGRRALLPASKDVCHWLASPESAAAQLVHAAGLADTLLLNQRALVMPGVSVTVAALLEALEIRAGSSALSLIDQAEPPLYSAADFPAKFDVSAAKELGFPLFETQALDFVDGYLRHINR